MSTAPLLAVGEKQIVTVPEPDGSLALMFERLAKDPNVDVEKLERLIAMQERIMRYNSEAAFNVAFTRMLPKIPTIIERAHTDKTSYAPLEDIIEPLRPVLAADGFSLSFKTEWPDPKTVKVIGILTHTEGHARQSEFLSAADQTGSKNAIQALASAVTYGKRYTAKDLLCIVTRGEDDDATKAGAKDEPPTPKGYEEWLSTLEEKALEGMPVFSKFWNDSDAVHRSFLVKTAPKLLNNIRAKANSVKAAGKAR